MALDVGPRRAVELASDLDGIVDGVKVGYEVVLGGGLEALAEVADAVSESFVLVDLKTADIPYVSASIAEGLREAGADAMIVHGFVGRDTVEACAKVLSTVVVATMSHDGARLFYDRIKTDVVEMCEDIDGVLGFVAPATRPSVLREVVEATDKPVFSPGVGAQGAEPGSAIGVGASFEIVGRMIIGADDPVAMAKELADILREAMRSSRPSDPG